MTVRVKLLAENASGKMLAEMLVENASGKADNRSINFSGISSKSLSVFLVICEGERTMTFSV